MYTAVVSHIIRMNLQISVLEQFINLSILRIRSIYIHQLSEVCQDIGMTDTVGCLSLDQ